MFDSTAKGQTSHCIIRIGKLDMVVIDLSQFISSNGPSALFQALLEGQDIEKVLQRAVRQGHPMKLDGPQLIVDEW